jgi:hypothetical protein
LLLVGDSISLDELKLNALDNNDKLLELLDFSFNGLGESISDDDDDGDGYCKVLLLLGFGDSISGVVPRHDDVCDNGANGEKNEDAFLDCGSSPFDSILEFY